MDGLCEVELRGWAWVVVGWFDERFLIYGGTGSILVEESRLLNGD
jgi:hypothetical protein